MTTLDPADPASFAHKHVVLPSGRKYHVVDQAAASGAAGAPVILLCHGFPRPVVRLALP